MKRFKNLICVLIILSFMLSFTSCSDSKELDKAKKDIESYKSQIENLKKENDELKKKSTNSVLSTKNNTVQSNNDEYKETAIGQKITFDNVAEIVINKSEFSNKILPSNASGYYQYYEEKDKDNKTYFHVIGTYKNLGTEEIIFSDAPIKFEIKYNDKYTYTGFSIAEESGGNDFSLLSIAKPLSDLKFHILIEVPNEVKNTGNLDLFIKKGNDIYKLKIK